jgi:hypothetical protein
VETGLFEPGWTNEEILEHGGERLDAIDDSECVCQLSGWPSFQEGRFFMSLGLV